MCNGFRLLCGVFPSFPAPPSGFIDSHVHCAEAGGAWVELGDIAGFSTIFCNVRVYYFVIVMFPFSVFIVSVCCCNCAWVVCGFEALDRGRGRGDGMVKCVAGPRGRGLEKFPPCAVAVSACPCPGNECCTLRVRNLS